MEELKEGDSVLVLRQVQPDVWKPGKIKRVCNGYYLYYLVTLEASQLTVEVSPKHIRKLSEG